MILLISSQHCNKKLNKNNLFVILNNYTLLEHYWYTGIYCRCLNTRFSVLFIIFLLLFIDCKAKIHSANLNSSEILLYLYHEFIEDNTQKEHLWNDLKQFNFIHFYTNLKCAIFAFLFLFLFFISRYIRWFTFTCLYEVGI